MTTQWTDERIKTESIGIVSRNLMTKIRDDMQAEIDALRQQLADTPAGQWQPVDATAFDIAETPLNPALELHDGHIIVLRQNTSETEEANEMSIDLGGEYTICRRVE